MYGAEHTSDKLTLWKACWLYILVRNLSLALQRAPKGSQNFQIFQYKKNMKEE